MRSEHHHKICLLLAQKSLTHCRIRFFFDHFRISSKGALYRSLIRIWGTAESSEDQNATLWGNSKPRIWLVFPTWIAKFRSDVFIICCDSFQLLRIWYNTLWDQFLTVPISNMRALSCYLKCWESLPKQSDQVITFDQQVKLTFSWWCSRILFAFKSTIVAWKVKRQIMNSIRSNVAEYWVDHKYWKHHKAISVNQVNTHVLFLRFTSQEPMQKTLKMKVIFRLQWTKLIWKDQFRLGFILLSPDTKGSSYILFY